MIPDLFAAALVEVEDELDWALLGDLYCHEGGEGFFPPEQREAVREAGLLLAGDVADAVERLGRGGPGRSLYVGAGVAELAPILCERLVLGREVLWCNALEEEVRELARALAVAGERVDAPLPLPVAGGPGEVPGPFDHLWLVSVLTDPETYPALGAELYGHDPRPSAAALAADRERAERLVEEVLERLAPLAVLSTTDEELAVVEPAVRRRGARLRVPERARLSGIVGDPVRVCSYAGG